MESVPHLASAPLGFLEKVRLVIACGVAAFLLWSIGWRVAQPVDPHMALTLSASWGRVVAVWPTLMVLAAISAAVGTILIGRRLPEAGMFASATGLLALSLCGGSMQAMLAYRATTEVSGRRSLMSSMVLDCLLWTAVLAACWLFAEGIRRWLWPEPAAPATPLSDKKSTAGKSRPPEPAPNSRARQGWIAFVVCLVVGILVVWATISRTPVAAIARGQVIASVCGGLFAGGVAARYFTGITDVRWYILAAPAAALISYFLGYMNADMSWAQGTIYQPYALLATTPPHDLARPLPVEYVAAGVAGVLLGFWWGGHLSEETDQRASS